MNTGYGRCKVVEVIAQLYPPLTIDEREIDDMIEILDATVTEMESGLL